MTKAMTKAMIVRGLPGSGKDTFLRSLERHNKQAISVCSADDYFMVDGEYRFAPERLTEAHDHCFKKFAEQCNDGSHDIIAVSNTNTRLFEMSPYIMYARCLRIPVEIFEVALVEYKQFVHLELQTRNLHGVPMAAIEGMDKRWENIPPFWPKSCEVQSYKGGFAIFDSDGNVIERIEAVTEG
jgi:hypothetical protein